MNFKQILFLDTTTSHLYLGISHPENGLQSISHASESQRYHSAIITPAIDKLLTQAEVTVNELEAIAVVCGPGSFTGLRTGLITARTMAQFLKLPVFRFNRFDLLAAQQKGAVSIHLDALRGKSFHALLEVKDGASIYHSAPQLIQLSEGSRDSETTQAPLLIAESLQPWFQEESAHIIPSPEVWKPLHLMHELIQQNPTHWKIDWQSLHPLYLQEPSVTLKKTAPHSAC